MLTFDCMYFVFVPQLLFWFAKSRPLFFATSHHALAGRSKHKLLPPHASEPISPPSRPFVGVGGENDRAKVKRPSSLPPTQIVLLLPSECGLEMDAEK